MSLRILLLCNLITGFWYVPLSLFEVLTNSSFDWSAYIQVVPVGRLIRSMAGNSSSLLNAVGIVNLQVALLTSEGMVNLQLAS